MAAFRIIMTIAKCLADELINAENGSSNSHTIKKKNELERVAKSNRKNISLLEMLSWILAYSLLL